MRAVDYGLFDSANHYNDAGDAFTRRTTPENNARDKMKGIGRHGPSREWPHPESLNEPASYVSVPPLGLSHADVRRFTRDNGRRLVGLSAIRCSISP